MSGIVKDAVNKAEALVTGKSHGKGLILITGASSFVATPIIKLFIANGYYVRGQARSESSAKKIYKVFPDYGDKLTIAIVPDITAEGAFDEAVKGVDGVIHTASPFVLDVNHFENDLLIPAIKGTNRVLESVHAHAPQVKRVVVTSSIAAILDPLKGLRPGYTYTEEDWNPVTYEQAAAGPGAIAYCGSKTFGERAAWDFVEQKKPNFTISTVNPPMVYGPAEHYADINNLNTSTADIWRQFNGSQKAPGPTPFPAFVDVRDVAEAHFRAYEREQSGRYFATAGNFSFIDVAAILREAFPERADRIPDPALSAREESFKVDNSKTTEALGIQWRGLKESIVDTAKSLLALEKGELYRA
ncbi:hypothetical protein SLS53_006612 [Cytospora paraplurivora]|uniref:NAD-dependent epimerase/dehydratase domain-containing protein n=1 Tax=Cytospora paraplurivora TaxID=2898453 RepID=A0AAN9YEU4_9PEZI